MCYKTLFKTDAERLSEAERLVKMYAKGSSSNNLSYTLPCLDWKLLSFIWKKEATLRKVSADWPACVNCSTL